MHTVALIRADLIGAVGIPTKTARTERITETSLWIFRGGVSHFIREMIMSKIHCVPHETGISFTYNGVQYVYNADGFWYVGEEGVQSLEESDVPLIVSELAEHSIGITGDRPPRYGKK